MKNSVAMIIATWAGCGYSPFAPGTIGSAAAIAIAYAATATFPVSPLHIGVAGVALLGPAIWSAKRAALLAGKKDPGLVVVDEVVGQWLTLAGATSLNWKSWIGAFLLFRMLDIWKPAPVKRLEQLPGGFGIVADDAMAGVYGALVLYLAGWCNLY
jgi:phosphatidylglycerophosphatase A